MTTPDANSSANEQDSPDVPPVAPAYSTPPPEGIPDADND
jgi:hypothetical protein